MRSPSPLQNRLLLAQAHPGQHTLLALAYLCMGETPPGPALADPPLIRNLKAPLVTLPGDGFRW